MCVQPYCNLSISPKRLPFTILDLLDAYWDLPQRAFSGLYCCLKFGQNQCSSFDNMAVLILYACGLKMPIHALKLGVFGVSDAINGK